MRYYLKKCPKCEKYSDISVEKCGCGENLINIVVKKVNGPLQEEQINEIDDTMPVFEQRCPSCTKIVYIFDKNLRYEKCPHCKKAAIKNQEPKLVFPEEPKESKTDDGGLNHEIDSGENEELNYRNQNKQKNESILGWEQLINNITNEYHITDVEKEKLVEEKNENTTIVLQMIGKNTEIVFHAGDAPILLGRYVLDSIDEGDKKEKGYQQLEELLANDIRVSGFHCHLIYKKGSWYVKDGSWAIPEKGIPERKSTNSTRVNEKKVEDEVRLFNNDVIKLGNQRDSVRLVITIK